MEQTCMPLLPRGAEGGKWKSMGLGSGMRARAKKSEGRGDWGRVRRRWIGKSEEGRLDGG